MKIQYRLKERKREKDVASVQFYSILAKPFWITFVVIGEHYSISRFPKQNIYILLNISMPSYILWETK